MVLFAVALLGGLGLIFGVLLGLASRMFSIQVDPKVEQILKVLPGTNCGACGFTGCRSMAEALVKGNVNSIPCPAMTGESAARISVILGKELGIKEALVARILCQGEESKLRFHYKGIEDCHAARLVFGGFRACDYACLGLGSCKSVCPFDAIWWEKGKIPKILTDKCTGCGRCVEICPMKVISLIPKRAKVYVKCHSTDKGAKVRRICKNGCIACGLCVKVCKVNAIRVENNLAIIDYEKCTNCGACVEKCPTKCIVME